MLYMHLFAVLLCLLTLYSVCCDAEIEFFPDIRKPEMKWSNNADIDIETGYPNQDYALQRLSEYFKEKFRLSLDHGAERKPAFSYRFPDHPHSINSKSSRPFAVDPSDPRYYSKTPIIPDYASDPYKSAKLEDISDDEDSSEIDDEIETPVKVVPPTTVTPTHQRKLYNGDLVRGDTMSNGVRIVPATISVEREKEAAGLYIIAVVAGVSAAATVGIIVFGIGYYNLQRNAKAAADVEYPAYGVTGPHKDVSPSGDRRLAQSAHMYHYQHQKQQILAMERAANERHGSVSEADSDEENEEGDYTVYECPGLAPTGEMEVKNPLFQDDPTPATGATNDKSPTTAGAPDLK